MFLVGALLRFGSVAAWVFHIACMGGCLSCDAKPKLTYSLDGQLKGQTTHTWKPSKANLSDGFWTTSTYDMENSAVQSCGSVSSTSMMSQMHDTHGAGCSSKPSEFVNHGLLLWNQIRLKWVGNKNTENQGQQLREPKLSWNATYDSVLSNNKPFRKPIPLGLAGNDRLSCGYLGAGRNV